MAWVPLAASGLQYEFFKAIDVPGLPDFVTFDASSSILTLAQPGEPQDADASWMVQFLGVAEVRVRVSANSFWGRIDAELDYYPAYFMSQDKDGNVLQVDNAATNDGTGYIKSFIPDQLTLDASPASVMYGSSAFNSDGWVYLDRAWAFLIEVWVDSPEPPEEPCCPLSNSRLFKGIASKYRAAQHQPIRARRSQKRCLQVDFNGALDEGDTITQVTWECVSPWITFMEKAGIGDNGRYVCVDVTFNYPGIGYVKATIDTASGSRENYEFEVTVSDAPMYPTAQYIPSNGPYQLVASVI